VYRDRAPARLQSLRGTKWVLTILPVPQSDPEADAFYFYTPDRPRDR
jgi:hypothetical protein